MELTGAQLWMHALTDLDCEKYRHPDTAVARRRDMYADHGLPEAELDTVATGLEDWLPYLYTVVEASKRLRGGEWISIGGREWEVIHTPGHSVGHVCLYSPALGTLLSGDHLLPGITPPVTFERRFDPDPLGSYLDSLARIRERMPRVVLPGHGRRFTDCARRIDLILSHKTRLMGKVRAAIEEKPRTLIEIADVLFSSTMMHFQRHFVLSETLAHIAYLRHRGIVERRVRPDGVYEWYATGESAEPRRGGR
jgi:glyoxylase-like metal-dependent hydrolase (beta-lactamase superfamily II)